MPRRKLINLREAGDLLGVSYWTVRRWISQGELTGYRLGPKTIKLSEAEVLAYLDGKEIPNARTRRRSRKAR